MHIRAHNLFTSGDGSYSLKWGSTNVYTEDANGKPVYDWTIVDHIFDTYHELGIKPLVELGFMPEALSTNPEPYRHNFPQGSIFTGWAYPPKDYQKWAELVFHFVQHLRQRYGDAETRSWLWEVWNEPDIPYWKGTRDEYFKLYDYAADAVLRALPSAQVGGPDTTGPLRENSAGFLRTFLEHCAHQPNHATGKTGAPLNFISFHPKGAPVLDNGHVRMGISHQLAAIRVDSRSWLHFRSGKRRRLSWVSLTRRAAPPAPRRITPVRLPQRAALRRLYAPTVLKQIYALAAEDHVNVEGAVTWAFEFEGQPFCRLPVPGDQRGGQAGVERFPCLDFLMESALPGHTGAIPADEILQAGVRGRPEIDAMATRRGQEMEILFGIITTTMYRRRMPPCILPSPAFRPSPRWLPWSIFASMARTAMPTLCGRV